MKKLLCGYCKSHQGGSFKMELQFKENKKSVFFLNPRMMELKEWEETLKRKLRLCWESQEAAAHVPGRWPAGVQAAFYHWAWHLRGGESRRAPGTLGTSDTMGTLASAREMREKTHHHWPGPDYTYYAQAGGQFVSKHFKVFFPKPQGCTICVYIRTTNTNLKILW